MSTESLPPAAPRKPLRLWIPLVLLGMASLLSSVFFFAPGIDDGLRFPFATIPFGPTVAILNLWWLFGSGLTRRTKVVGLALEAALFLLVFSLVRLDGWTGSMYPVLAWRWSPHPEAKSRLAPVVSTEKAVVDLTRTTEDDSPRFMGPHGNGQIRNAFLDSDWVKHPPQELWRIPVGLGWSAFAVVGDFGITQEQRDQAEVVVCRRLKTGDVVWTHTDPGRFSEWMGGDGPRATPTIVDGDVFVMAAIGLLHRLDGETGKPRWTRDILKDHQAVNMQWGKSCSPLVYDDLVVVTLGEKPDTPSLGAYSQETGELVWSTGKDKAAYGTPVLTTLAGRRQIVVCNAHTVAGHDPQTGALLWSHQMSGQMSKSSNVLPVSGDRVLATAGYGVGALLLKVESQGDTLGVKTVWENPRVLKTRFTNAVLHDKFLYGLDDGILQCVELDTGKSRWKAGRYGQGQVLCVQDVLLVQCESGDLVLVQADPRQHREVARLKSLTAKTWNYPTLAGKYLLVRNGEEAVCYVLEK